MGTGLDDRPLECMSHSRFRGMRSGFFQGRTVSAKKLIRIAKIPLKNEKCALKSGFARGPRFTRAGEAGPHYAKLEALPHCHGHAREPGATHDSAVTRR